MSPHSPFAPDKASYHNLIGTYFQLSRHLHSHKLNSVDHSTSVDW